MVTEHPNAHQNEEEVPVAIVANESERDKISNYLMYLIIELILDDVMI